MKVFRMNLPRHHVRKDFGNGALVAMEVPYEEIVIWEGKDTVGYKKTYQLFEDAVADGFPHFQEMLDGYADDWIPIAYASHHWNWCRLLRHLATQQTEPAIVLLDDYFLSKPYPTYHDLCMYAQKVAAEQKTSLKYIALTHNTAPESQFTEVERVMPENILYEGIPSNGTDAASIITPAGARWLLKQWSRLLYPILEGAFLQFIQKDIDLSGVYTHIASVVKIMPKEISKSTMHVDGDFDNYLRPLEVTRRDDHSAFCKKPQTQAVTVRDVVGGE